MTGTAMTVTPLRVPKKTNEITCFAALLNPYDLQEVTVTGDALHTQREHARFLVDVKKAHYAFAVKRNQKNPYEQMRHLPWEQAKAKFYDRTTGHGRKETRVVQALTVADLGVDFPHAAQVAGGVRHRIDTRTGRQSRETVYVITDPTSRQASPERIATILRSHWVIDTSGHWPFSASHDLHRSEIRRLCNRPGGGAEAGGFRRTHELQVFNDNHDVRDTMK